MCSADSVLWESSEKNGMCLKFTYYFWTDRNSHYKVDSTHISWFLGCFLHRALRIGLLFFVDVCVILELALRVGFVMSCWRILVRMSCRLYTECQMMFGYAGVNINAVILQLQAVMMGLFVDLNWDRGSKWDVDLLSNRFTPSKTCSLS